MTHRDGKKLGQDEEDIARTSFYKMHSHRKVHSHLCHVESREKSHYQKGRLIITSSSQLSLLPCTHSRGFRKSLLWKTDGQSPPASSSMDKQSDPEGKRSVTFGGYLLCRCMNACHDVKMAMAKHSKYIYKTNKESLNGDWTRNTGNERDERRHLKGASGEKALVT